jgi:cyclase
MKRTLIVARIRPGAERDVARIFAESDATSMPHDIGVRERSLYRLNDLYIHLIEFDREAEHAMAIGQAHRGFGEISARLRPFISPYDPPNWHSPEDAMPARFYHWAADGSAR